MQVVSVIPCAPPPLNTKTLKNQPMKVRRWEGNWRLKGVARCCYLLCRIKRISRITFEIKKSAKCAAFIPDAMKGWWIAGIERVAPRNSHRVFIVVLGIRRWRSRWNSDGVVLVWQDSGYPGLIVISKTRLSQRPAFYSRSPFNRCVVLLVVTGNGKGAVVDSSDKWPSQGFKPSTYPAGWPYLP